MDHTPKIFISRPDVPESGLQLLKGCVLDVWEGNDFVPRKTFLERIAGKDALFIYSGNKIDAEALDAAGPNLKVIATMSSGLDHIDVNEVKKRGIKLGCTAGILEDAVAELTIGLLIAGMRKFFEGRDHIASGTWPKWTKSSWMNGRKIKGSVVGIVGFGNIGAAIGKRLLGFEPAKILYVAKSPKKEGLKMGAFHTSLDDVCKESDIIIISLSLNEQTRGIFNEDKFNKMKPNAFVVNVSRGAVIEQNALVKALRENQIAGAALDVMTPEPLPKDHELLKLNNLTLLPHIGSAEVSTRIRMAELLAHKEINPFTSIHEVGSKKYLNLNVGFPIIRLYSQLRVANKDRTKFTANNITYKWSETLICQTCNLEEAETLEHFLLRCPTYTEFRKPTHLSLLQLLQDSTDSSERKGRK